MCLAAGNGGRNGNAGDRGGGKQENGNAGGKQKRKSDKGADMKRDVDNIVNVVKKLSWDPVIVFSFSRRECENYALALKNVDFTTDEEKAQIEEVRLPPACLDVFLKAFS